jgi:hypothetical protein
MLETLLTFIAGFAAQFLQGALSDWRRDRAIKQTGRQEVELAAANNRADVERRYAEIATRGLDAAGTARRLRNGEF